MFAGAGFQTSGVRWGDYTQDRRRSLQWHGLLAYQPICNGGTWHTRIGKFNFVGGGVSPTPTPISSATPTATPGSCTWSAGPDLPSVGTRMVGVFFPGERQVLRHGRPQLGYCRQRLPCTRLNTTRYQQLDHRGLHLPDNQVNNMACGVLNDSGTHYIYCVGGSAAGQTTATDRVFSYNPVTDRSARLPGPGLVTWERFCLVGFRVLNNKFYVLGGFNINIGMSTDQFGNLTPCCGRRQWMHKSVTCRTALAAYPRPRSAASSTWEVAADYQGGTTGRHHTSFSLRPCSRHHRDHRNHTAGNR